MNCKKCKSKLRFASTVCHKCGTDNFPTNCRKCQTVLKKGKAICPKCGKNNLLIRPWMRVPGMVLAVLLILAALAYALFLICVPKENNVFYKGSYSIKTSIFYSSKQLKKDMETVVATMGDAKLTNGQLQAYYWMEARNYVTSAKDKGVPSPDLDKPFHTQIYNTKNGMTWQQFFLQEALNTWHEHQVLMLEAKKAGYVMPQYYRAQLDGAEARLTTYATNGGYYDSLDAYLHERLGEGADLQDYLDYLEGEYTSTLYRQELEKSQVISDKELNSYFEANKTVLSQQHSVTKESGDIVDLRLLLVSPEGGTETSDGNKVYSEDEWNACYEKAQALYQQWQDGDADEDSFMLLSDQDTFAGDMKKGDLDTAVEAWCFDDARVAGDHDLIKGTEGYYLAYFLEREAEWERYSRNGILEVRMAEIVNSLTAKNSMTVDYAKILLGVVSLT